MNITAYLGASGGSTPRRLTKETQALAEAYMPLAKRAVSGYVRKMPWRSAEIVSAAYLALCEAAACFDPSRGVKFSTFAYFKIRCDVSDAVKAMIAREQIASEAREDHSNPHELVDPISEIGLREFDDLDEAEQYLRKLPRKHREAVRQTFLMASKNQIEDAKKLGCCASYVSRLLTESRLIMNGA